MDEYGVLLAIFGTCVIIIIYIHKTFAKFSDRQSKARAGIYSRLGKIESNIKENNTHIDYLRGDIAEVKGKLS